MATNIYCYYKSRHSVCGFIPYNKVHVINNYFMEKSGITSYLNQCGEQDHGKGKRRYPGQEKANDG